MKQYPDFPLCRDINDPCNACVGVATSTEGKVVLAYCRTQAQCEENLTARCQQNKVESASALYIQDMTMISAERVSFYLILRKNTLRKTPVNPVEIEKVKKSVLN